MKREQGTQSEGPRSSSYNVLWSIVQTMKPSLFSRAPAVVAERRHKDKDPIARLAAEVIERGTEYQIEFSEFADAINDAVLDVLLVARGVPWVIFENDEKPDISVARYQDPKDESEGFMTSEGDSVSERKGIYHSKSGKDVSDDEDLAESEDLMTRQDGFSDQRIMVDYVHWKDFAHSPLSKWRAIQKRGWVARRVSMSMAEGIDRFGEDFARVEMTTAQHEHDDTERARDTSRKKMAAVWEIWDAKSKKRIHIAKGLEKALEVKDDPYGLEKFFPCPRPAYATTTNEDLVPVPDYAQYSELAEELDILSARIRKLTQALKACGAYDGSIEGLGRLMNLEDGQLVAVSGMQAVTAKGGLGNAIQWMPISEIAQAIQSLDERRERLKALLYDVSGISDIVRGQVDPREKASQSKIKAQFAQSRIDQRRRAVERCARDTVRIISEMMIELFEDDRLRKQSGFDMLPEIESLKERFQEAQKQHQQAAQGVPAGSSAAATATWTTAPKSGRPSRTTSTRSAAGSGTASTRWTAAAATTAAATGPRTAAGRSSSERLGAGS